MHTYKLFLAILLSTIAWPSFSSPADSASYVGSEQCATCHSDEFSQWQQSHHYQAMQHASEEFVLGNFEDVTLTFRDKPNRFFRKGEEFWVNIQGPDGEFHDYKIDYTFGYKPLQQYMVSFDDGRVQLIPFAWDSRPAEEGGQRWFDLYPDHNQTHHEFYWTNVGQNWNFMCADCHSTNVKKGFDSATNTYQTTFDEITVGCEACHGPASAHIEWTRQQDPKSDKGFLRDLGAEVTQWLSAEGSSVLQPADKTETDQLVTCAQCHSRRTQISEVDQVAEGDFNHRYLLSHLTSGLYYPDGQIYDEVYVYGSFIQTKMHAAGVTCTNCHNPHTAELVLPKEQICLQCHTPATYATEAHHMHQPESEGAQCVNCHMPETTYMQIDPRRDHSYVIPRPDLALQTGTRDICLDCHDDKDSRWSLEQLGEHYTSPKHLGQEHFALAFAAADLSYQPAANELSKISQDKNNAPIVRASALQRMRTLPNQNTLIAAARGVKSPDSNIRLGAIEAARGLRTPERWRVVSPLLSDPVLAVRTQAVQALTPAWQDLSETQRKQLKPGIDEYLTILEFNADRGYSHTNKANMLANMGRFEEAIAAYDKSIALEPYFAAAYLNKADVYRQQGNEQVAMETLEAGMKAQREDGNIPYSLGLAYIRQKQSAKAIEYFAKATEIEPQNPNFHYVYGLSLESSDVHAAQQALQKAWQVGQNPEHLYALCDMQVRYKSFNARQCLAQLSKVAPPQAVQRLQQQLNRQ